MANPGLRRSYRVEFDVECNRSACKSDSLASERCDGQKWQPVNSLSLGKLAIELLQGSWTIKVMIDMMTEKNCNIDRYR